MEDLQIYEPFIEDFKAKNPDWRVVTRAPYEAELLAVGIVHKDKKLRWLERTREEIIDQQTGEIVEYGPLEPPEDVFARLTNHINSQ